MYNNNNNNQTIKTYNSVCSVEDQSWSQSTILDKVGPNAWIETVIETTARARVKVINIKLKNNPPFVGFVF